VRREDDVEAAADEEQPGDAPHGTHLLVGGLLAGDVSIAPPSEPAVSPTTMLTVRTFCVVIACLTLSAPSLAQSASQRLFRVNSLLSSGFSALDEIRWNAPPDNHLKSIDRAESFAAQAQEKLTPDLKTAPAYGSVLERLEELKAKVGMARGVSTCHRERDRARTSLAAKDLVTARTASGALAELLAKLKGSTHYATVIAELDAESRALTRELNEFEKTETRALQEKARLEAEQKKAQQKEEAAARARAEAEEKARLKAEAAAKLAAAVEEKKRLAEEAKQRAAEERRIREEEAKKQAEAKRLDRLAKEQARRDEAERKRAELEARRLAEAEARLALERQRDAERNDPRRALREVRTAVGRIEASLTERPGPVPPALFVTARRALAELVRLDPVRGRAEGVTLDALALLSFARAPAGAPPLGAVIATTLNARKPTTTLNARPGWCYAFVAGSSHPFKATTTSTAPLFRWTQTGSTSSQASGFCVGETMTVQVDVELDPTAKPVLLLGWIREKTPLAVTLRARLDGVDPCDREALAALWKAPVPGIVAYANDTAVRGPVLLLDPGSRESVQARVLATNGVEVLLQKAALSSTVLAAPMATVPVEQCPQAGERPSRPADPVMCRAASDAAAAPVLAALKAKLAAAADDAARMLVEQDLRNLDDEAARRRELDCQPVKYAPTEGWRRTQHDEILMSPPSPGSRPEILVLDAPEAP
jgi:chemotaxis protein histidine kinase CheA